MKRRALLVVLVVLAVGVSASWWMRPVAVAERRFERVLADLRARGVPTTLDEIARPSLAPGEDGWPDLVAALEWRDAHAPEGWGNAYVGLWNDACLHPWWETSTPEEMAALAAFLDDMEPFLERVEAAALKSTIRLPLLPKDETGMRAATHIPVLQQLVRMLDGYAHGASTEPVRRRAIRAMAATARGMEPPLTMIEHLVACTTLRQASKALRAELAAGRVDPGAARADLDALFDVRWIDRMASVAAAERTTIAEWMPHILDGSFGSRPGASELLELMWARLRAGRNPFSEGLWWDFDPVRAVEEIEALDAAAALDPSWNDGYEAEVAACFPIPPSGSVWSVLRRVIANAREADAELRLTRVVLAAHVYFEAHGGWPETAGDLASLFDDGAVPIDPYSGEAFAWSRDGDALTIEARPWSVDDPSRYVAEEARLEAGLIWRSATPPR